MRKEAINLMRLVENCNSYNLFSWQHCHVVSGFLDIKEHSSRRHIIVEKTGTHYVTSVLATKRTPSHTVLQLLHVYFLPSID
jgi:hypothetical protein